MASVEEIKAGVTRFGEETGRQVTAIRAVAQSMDQTSAMLRAITQGSNHPQVGEALTRIEEVKRRLDEATRLASGAVEAAKRYSAGF
jgi:hypothetical protein